MYSKLTVSGIYILSVSCFGTAIEALVQMHGQIREVPTSLLLDLVRYGQIVFSRSYFIVYSKLTVSGIYILSVSCFVTTIEVLVQMHGPIREVPTSLLLDLVRYGQIAFNRSYFLCIPNLLLVESIYCQ